VARSFDELVAEAAAVPVEGWDFSWLEGRATEQRPSWGFRRLLGERLSLATAALDIQTGGGEVLAGAGSKGRVESGDVRHHEVEAGRARAAGLDVVQCRNERLRLEFFDVGAVVFFLRKVVWTVPGFAVDRYRARLMELHDQIEQDGVFRSTMSRTLFEARKSPTT
jgi:hypothetical protein